MLTTKYSNKSHTDVAWRLERSIISSFVMAMKSLIVMIIVGLSTSSALAAGTAGLQSQLGLDAFGRVLDAMDRPLANVPVVLENRTTGLHRTVVTDQQGKFGMQEMGNGDIWIYSRSIGYFSRSLVVHVGDRAHGDIIYRMVPAESRISGRVIDADGHPVIEAKVYLYTADGVYAGECETDLAGGYVLPCIRGDYLVRVSEEGYQTIEEPVSIVSTGRREVNLTVSAARGQIQARVTDFVGRPVPAAKVTVYSSAAARSIATGQTLSDGTYSVDVGPGEYTLVATSDRYTYEPVEVHIYGDHPAQVTLVGLPSTLTVAGCTVDALGRPLDGVKVGVYSDSGELVASTTSDFAGRYSMKLSPGRWSVKAWKPGYTSRELDMILNGTVKESEVDISLLTADSLISVKVVDEYGHPLPGSWVEVADPENGGWIDTAVCNESGLVAVRVPRGRYRVSVMAAGFERRVVELQSVTPAESLLSGSGQSELAEVRLLAACR